MVGGDEILWVNIEVIGNIFKIYDFFGLLFLDLEGIRLDFLL